MFQRSLLLFATLVVLLLPACQSGNSAPIRRGQTQDEVMAVLGTPVIRQYRGAEEAWQYGRVGAGLSRDSYQVIWFHEGKVTGTTTYSNEERPAQSVANFEQIQWADAPAFPGRASR